MKNNAGLAIIWRHEHEIKKKLPDSADTKTKAYILPIVTYGQKKPQQQQQQQNIRIKNNKHSMQKR